MLSDHATPIAQAYGVGTPVSEMIMVARGEQGRIWRVDTDTGAFAIKELIICQTPADAVADVAYQEAVLASRAVPMPRDLSARWPAKSLLMLLGIRFGRTSGSISCRWRRGRPGRDWCDIGRDTSGTPCAPARPLIGWYTEPVGAPRWTQLLDEAKAADAPFVEALDAEITELLRLEALIEPPANLQSCHRDFWADNILSTPTDGLCVIDWENCGLADPAQELPMAMVDFAFGDRRRVAELYLSFEEAGGSARISGYGSFTMVIAQFSHFWESAITAYFATSAADVKAHSLDRIAELLNPPLRVAHLEEMLDTIASIR